MTMPAFILIIGLYPKRRTLSQQLHLNLPKSALEDFKRGLQCCPIPKVSPKMQPCFVQIWRRQMVCPLKPSVAHCLFCITKGFNDIITQPSSIHKDGKCASFSCCLPFLQLLEIMKCLTGASANDYLPHCRLLTMQKIFTTIGANVSFPSTGKLTGTVEHRHHLFIMK